ncbi:inositol monophosphatase family protein [Roseovarius aestuariivivens]|uniref:inositol monophosphatase family protein n=1 Tax=Roseovarius aestuariivivens TaxID=1888910 RepID=UPI0010815FC4|nr:inositol monophosphatase [Roseovarius aestuariivivens]
MSDSLPIPLSSPLSLAQTTAILNLVRRAARAEILPRFRNLGAGDVGTKAHRFDLVTEADEAAEAMILRGIQRMFPHALVVGEEMAAREDGVRARLAEAELAFIVDPLDGTWNFAHGLPLFGVILSVARFGVPVFGLLYDPIMDDWILAEENGPARMSRKQGAARSLSVARGGAPQDLSGFVHLYLLPEDKRAQAAALLPQFARTQMLRCSCHEYRMLAQGAMDFTISGTMNPWDHAAGVLIFQRAGGVVRMLDGSDYNAGLEDGYLLAAPDQATWDKLAAMFAFLAD